MKPLASLTFPGPSALEHPDGGNQPVAAPELCASRHAAALPPTTAGTWRSDFTSRREAKTLLDFLGPAYQHTYVRSGAGRFTNMNI
jgi:hypothetical protein